MAIFSGDIFAENYTVSSSVTNVQISSVSGSTKSGDSGDDTHQFTGSLFISASRIDLVDHDTKGTFLGFNAGTGSGDGTSNVGIGYEALTSPNGAQSIVAIGRGAGKNITKSSQSGVYSILL